MMTSVRKSTIFRVTGLATTQPDDELDAALKTAIHDNLLEEERARPVQIVIAIVPSCYGDGERVALVEFRGGIPQFLSELEVNPLGDWQVEMGDTDISFDRHFFGFTQLYAPKLDVPIAADIIAITGLDGHAYGSWRGKGNLGRMWLRDFLSKDLPNCRTMIYGYNSKLSTHGVDTIMDYGRELMEEIKKIRNEKNLRQRPLFFIGHSFGGIILAHCLIKAALTNEDDHPTIASLYRATYGVLLFATPHKGLLINDIQNMLDGQEKHPRNALLQQVNNKSDLLISQLADFKNIIRDRKIVSFYETEQTRQLELNSESKRWARTGDFITAVETDSALLQLPDHIEDKIPLHADHSMIVKFDNNNAHGYRSALDRLKQFEQDAPRVVAARFSAGLAQARDRPKPLFTVPFQKDNMFVGREDIIEKIRTGFQNHSRVALIGLGGVGKSQIAIEYAYRIKESALPISVFWIHASSAVRFEQAYRDIAAKVKLPGRNDPEADILRLVYDWLCDEKNGQWLMIMDNADDNDVFFSPDSDLRASGQTNSTFNEKTPLVGFIPQTPNGCILVTSRNMLAAMNLIGMQHNNIIRVEPMNDQDAVALLQTRFPVGGSSEHKAKALVQALECIPLAVTQAAAYILVREITFSTYLDLFHESEANQAHILKNEETKDLRRDPTVRHTVITTWQISFEQIQRTNPAATDLLALMSMFDRQGIPEDLLHDDSTNRLQFEDAMAPLISFSLVKKQTGQEIEKRSFEMHRLVQLSTRKWLELNQQLQKWRKESLKIVAIAFPSGEYETWTACQELLPHSKMVLSYMSNDEDNEEVLNRATIAYNTGQYLNQIGDYMAAEKISRVGMEEDEKVLGPEHQKVLSSVSSLGMILTHLGSYDEAEALHQRALEGYGKVLGPRHPHTLISVNNLGLVLERQGKYDEAETMYQRALEECEKVLGPEHPHTLSSVNNLGLVLESQGKYDEAETLHRRALEAKEKMLGPEHPDTLISVNNLGCVLNKLGKYEESETMHQRALEAKEKVLGPEHPGTLTSVNNLGLVLGKLDKYGEAETMYRRALKAREKVLGPEHPSTLISVSNLGSVLESQGKYDEAEVMYRRALEAKEKVLGPEHPGTLTSVNNLGLVLGKLDKYGEAETMYRRALKAREKVLGPEHPQTLSSVNNLGKLLRKLDKYDEAEVMYRRALEAKEKVLGPEHPDTLISVSNLGLVLESQDKYDEAEALHRRALKAREKVLGTEHPDTLISMDNLGSVLGRQGKYDKAEALHRQALKAREKVLRPEHPDTLISMDNLGLVLEELGKYDEAEVMHRRALKAREKVLGPEHPSTLISVNNLGSVLESQGKYDEAEVMYQRDLEGCEKVLGPEHPDTLISMDNLGSVLESQGMYDEAEVMHRRALKVKEKVLGPEHPHTLSSVNSLGLVLESQGKYDEAEAMLQPALKKRQPE